MVSSSVSSSSEFGRTTINTSLDLFPTSSLINQVDSFLKSEKFLSGILRKCIIHRTTEFYTKISTCLTRVLTNTRVTKTCSLGKSHSNLHCSLPYLYGAYGDPYHCLALSGLGSPH